jgi:phosphatidate cytidylyltransferase
MPIDMKNLFPRVMTAAVLLLVLVPVIWFGGVIRTALVILLYGICMFELFSVTLSLQKRQLYVLVAVSYLLPLLVLGLGSELFLQSLFGVLFLLSLTVIAIAEGTSNKPDFNRLVSMPLMALVYPGLLLVSLLIIDQRFSGEYILWVVSAVIMADTLAYFVGSLAGGRPLSPRISPNKTVSGSFAGILGAALTSLAWGTFFEFDQPVFRLVALGLCIGILSVVGDLFESLLKRSIGVKDMGSLLPGHGGVLDRIDAQLFALPVLFFL